MGRYEIWGILAWHILLSQKRTSRRCKSYTLIKTCNCVEFLVFLKYFFVLLWSWLSLSFWRNAFYFKVWTILFVSFLHAVWHAFCFLSCFLAWIYFLAYPILFFWHMKTFERDSCQIIGVFFYLVDGKTCFCVTLSVRVSILFYGCTWILIMGSWRESRQGSQQFDKAQCKYKQHMTKVLYHGILSYGLGRNYNHLRSMLIEILIL